MNLTPINFYFINRQRCEDEHLCIPNMLKQGETNVYPFFYENLMNITWIGCCLTISISVKYFNDHGVSCGNLIKIIKRKEKPLPCLRKIEKTKTI